MPAERFDVAVVGAGSAGCVVAARLSEHPSRRVVLFEQGPPSPVADEISVERTRDAPPTSYPIGRGLGGSSAVNAMLATPGRPADYDAWERDFGCVGWSWRDVAPYFERVAVPMSYAHRSQWGQVDRALVEAIRAEPALLTWSGRSRVTAADAYLAPVAGRPNLVVRADTAVARILIDHRRAVGVATTDGATVEARSIVVCAGAIGSPRLLHGAGVDRPGVGRGLKDHPSVMLALALGEPSDATGLVAATTWRAGDLQIVPLNYLDDLAYGGLVGGVLSSRSTGSVDPDGTVRFNQLSDERDVEAVRALARRLIDVARSAPFARVATVADLEVDDIDGWIATGTSAIYHAGCTCRMGPIDDDAAVVDVEGRVHGYTGLRVCDASIFPDLPRANTYLPVLMTAEKIAATMH